MKKLFLFILILPLCSLTAHTTTAKFVFQRMLSSPKVKVGTGLMGYASCIVTTGGLYASYCERQQRSAQVPHNSKPTAQPDHGPLPHSER
jgi:hypothetical protein